MTYTKTITPANGDYLGELFDGTMLIHDKLYSSYSVAERALDDLIVGILRDQHERGLLDDLDAAIEAEGVTSMHVPGWCREVCFDQYGIASDLLICPDCNQAVCQCNLIYPPLDVDYAPVGPIV